MASPRVFKKRYPRNSVGLSNGKFITFEDVGNELGFYVTDDATVIAEFEACMKRGAGGVSNSSMDEYQDAIKKKTPLLASKNKFILEEQTAGLVTIPEVPAAVSPVVSEDKPAAKPATPDAPAPEPKVGKKPK